MILFHIILFVVFQIQHNPTCKIVGNLNYCESNDIKHGDRFLAISKDGKVFNDKIKTEFNGDFEISGLLPGTYVIGYDNIFGQRVRKTIEVKETVTNLSLCVDEFQDTHVSTLFNTMQEGDTILLEVSSYGCFHHFEDEYTICLKNKRYSVSFKDEKYKVKTLNLDMSRLNSLISFEKMIRHVSKINGGSTTNDSYVFIKNGNTAYSATINTGWHGYTKIRKQILGLE